MQFQTILSNDLVKLIPLQETDFDELFAVAKDELIWEQHPDKNRYKKEVFITFFNDAIASKSAFKIIDLKTNLTIGSSRYYELNLEEKSIAIGYTFISREYWGTNYNKAIKKVMIDYAFQFVDRIIFHIGESNIRSRKAVEKLNAKLIATKLVEETQRTHVIYELKKI